MDKSKAILILDEMPKRCFDCKLRLSHIETFCIPTGKTISELWEYTDQKEGRPEWCPLQYPIIYSNLEKWQENEYKGGWNDAMFQIGAVTMEEAFPWMKED